MALTENEKRFKKIFLSPHYKITLEITGYYVRGLDDLQKIKPKFKSDLTAVQVKMMNNALGAVPIIDVKHFCNLPTEIL